MKKALRARQEGIMILDERGNIEFINRVAESLLQFESSEVTGRNIELFMPGVFLADLLSECTRPHEQTYEVKVHRKGGSTYPIEIVLSEIVQKQGNRFLVLMHDVSDRVTRRAALEYQVVYDSLTGLPNRILFYDRLHQNILTGKRAGAAFLLFILDIDDFHLINDQFGHAAGDWVLQQIAIRLSGELRESDTVARLGGDEFAILLPTTENTENARMVADKLMRAVAMPLQLHGQTLYITAKLGISVYPEHGSDAQSLIQHADLAMSAAKGMHDDNRIDLADSARNSKRNLQIKNDLHHSLERGELMLQYQPKVNVKSGRISSVESLMRWQHPQHDLLLPEVFVPLAEQTGFIRPLIIWSLRKGLEQCAKWREAGYEINVAVNLSGYNLQDEDLLDQLLDVINVTGTKPEWLELEISEAALMTEPAHAFNVLCQLDELGVRLSIDDFGKGFSSLACLRRFPVDEVKIDKSFVADMSEENDDSVLVRAMVDLAHNLGFTIAADGVVSYNGWSQLAAMGCDTAQGYYISRPLTASQMTRWLEETGAKVDWAHF